MNSQPISFALRFVRALLALAVLSSLPVFAQSTTAFLAAVGLYGVMPYSVAQ